MRITCESCSATFIAPDDKIRGRVAKYRCRKCGTTLVADGRDLAPDAPEDPTEVMSADAMLGGSDQLAPSLRPGAPKVASTAPPPNAVAPKPVAVAPKPTAGAPKPTAPKPTAGITPKPEAVAPKPTAGTPKPPVAAPRPKMPSAPPRPASAPAPAEVKKPRSVAPPPLPVESEHAPVSVSELMNIDDVPVSVEPASDHSPPPLPAKPKPRQAPRDASASFSLSSPDTEAPVARRRPPKVPGAAPDAPPILSEPLGVTEGKPSGLVDLQKLSEPGGIPEPPPSSGHVSFDALLGEPPPSILGPPPIMDEAPVLFSVPADVPDEKRRPPIPPKRVEAVPTPEPLPLVVAPVSVRASSIAPEARRRPYVLYVLAAAALGGGLFFLGQMSATKPDAPTKAEPTAPVKTNEGRTPDPAPTATPERTTTAPTASATATTAPSARATVDAGPPVAPKPDDRPSDPKPEPKSDAKPEPKPEVTKPDPKPEDTKPVTPPPPPPGDAGEFNKDAARAALGAAAGAAASCKTEDGPVGPARVKVTFSTTGRSTQAIIDGPPFAGTAVGSCIAQKFRGLSIPAFSGDPVTVTKTLTIQ